MSRALADLLGGAAADGAPADRTPPQLILDAASYAQRVLLQNRDMPWHDATAYANHLGQLQALLKPAVALVVLDRMLQHEIESNEQCRQAMAARSRTGFAAKTLLADEGVRQRAQDLIAAVVKTQREPVVLQLMSPLALLTLTDRAVDPASTTAFDAEDAEGTAIYVADWLRSFAEFDVAGVVFDERGDGDGAPAGFAGGFAGGFAESYQPIVNVAEHYAWTLGFRGAHEVRFTSPDAVIPVLEPGALGGSAPAELPPGGLLFAEIPEDAVPEQVLARLEGLRAVRM